ncbi:MAG: tRNA (5-methylaminomethyl-2-thiouridine)(34)-methyltransferase MnmD, partial [Burkholderiaceae bacterium]
MPTRIETERLAFDATGAPFSERYGDVYASRDGALAQARHVFLAGNALPERWRGRRQFVIVETGFGLGTNFLATWQAWRDDPQRCGRLHFVSVELHPVAADDLVAAAPAELQPLARELAAHWPMPLPGLHRLEFEGGRVVLTLALGDAREVVPRLVCGADAFYLDGFAPARNPQMWEPASIKALARLARPDARLATWTAARAVRDALADSGFEVELRAGFGRKRQMLAARFAPRW